ncbi:hypothetical protein [Streptomyces sp. NPDC095613]|uniref:hypothetical protein n=1 Tax=Streptomyces sp. NPDC095613 TaxID=3155540 RepID=UPI003325EF5C
MASRVGFLALIYFEVVSTLALLLGLPAANLFGVGKGVELAPDAASSAQAPKAEGGEHGFTEFMLSGLEVNVDRMRRNTHLTGGLIVAEAVMRDIAPVLGRQRAHEVVYEACRAAIETGTSLETQLLDHADLMDRLGADRIGQLCDPARYVGSAATMTRMVINSPARGTGDSRR